MDRSGVIQPHLQYNNNKEIPNMEETELNIFQGNVYLPSVFFSIFQVDALNNVLHKFLD